MNDTSRIGMGSSIGLIASFLLPWVQLLGLGVSGYNLSQLGSYGNLAWVVPSVGIVCLLANTSKQALGRARKSASMLGALITGAGTIFVITQISERAGEGFWHAIGIGVYVLLISSITLFVSGWMAPLETADKIVFGVFSGYFVMAIFLFAVFTGVFLALGTERVFKPDSYEVSALWLVLAAIISFCGAAVGGYACATISKSYRACQVLALIVLILGILLCIPAIQKRDWPNVRASEVPDLQAMQLAVTPAWMHVLTPVICAAGLLLGAKMRKLPAA